MHPRKLSLTATLTLAFSVLTIPILALVLALSFFGNARSIEVLVEQQVRRSQATTERAVTALILPVVRALEFLAEVVAMEPERFRTDAALDLIYHRLAATKRIDGIHVTFEDGFQQGVTKIDESRRRMDPHTPAKATLHAEILSAGERTRRQIYFSEWGKKIGEHLGTGAPDPRLDPDYVGARDTRGSFVAPPAESALIGETVLSIAAPILRRGTFIGAASAHMTARELSEFLSGLRQSPRTVAFILDGQGAILAHSDPNLTLAERAMSADADIIRTRLEEKAAPLLQRLRAKDDIFSFRTELEGVESSIALFQIRNSFGLELDALIITPVEDFLGPLWSNHTILAGLILVLIPLELLLIARLSRGLSRGISAVAAELDTIRSMKLDGEEREDGAGSRVREVAALQNGFVLLRRALRSFGYYVPLELVRKLTEGGEPVALGVEPRQLTVLFCDLENFSTAAQELPPVELLAQVSEYFSLATAAIADTGGTVDKFIGDAVMAFWNAPGPCADHALAACTTALQISRGLAAMNEEWRRAGRRTFRVRVGVHTGTALVGNIGTAERLSYTALGDTVNIAARLEGVNKEFGTTICISTETYRLVEGRVSVRALEPVEVKGRRGELMVYELTGLGGSHPVVTPVQVADPVPA